MSGQFDKTLLQILFIFTNLNTYVPLMFHAKIQPYISSGSGDFVILLLVVAAAILDIEPDPILQF